MRELLLKSQREYRAESESNPHELISNRAIQVIWSKFTYYLVILSHFCGILFVLVRQIFLYALKTDHDRHDSNGFSSHFSDIQILEQLLSWSTAQWTSLMHSQLLQAFSVTIIGRPCH